MAEKEVYFYEYCGRCRHETKKEEDEPCFECLNEPANEDSHEPVYFEKKK